MRSREGGSRASRGGVLMDRQDICLPIHGTVNHKVIPCIDTTSNSNTIARPFHPPQRPLRASPPIFPNPSNLTLHPRQNPTTHNRQPHHRPARANNTPIRKLPPTIPHQVPDPIPAMKRKRHRECKLHPALHPLIPPCNHLR